MSEKYGALAQVYDALMYDVSYEEWAEYLCGLLKKNGISRGAKVLEYACGTGNITMPLAKEGYCMTAVDISEEMLYEAQEKTRRNALRITYACGDMRNFQLNKPADAIICACDGVNYLLGQDDLDAFFKSAYGNLRGGGLLLFDISSSYKLADRIGNDIFYDDGDDQTYLWVNRYDEQKRTVTMELTLFVREGELYERFDETHVQKAWEREEIERALGNAGFSEIAAYGFMTESEPQEYGERIQFAAVRKGNKDE